MKTIKVSGATGVVLDWLVAKAEGATNLSFDTVATWWVTLDGKDRALRRGWAQAYLPSSDWAQGGPIFSEAKISASIDDSGVWIAWCQYNYADEKRFMQSGHTELVAKARCYIAMNLGLAVVVPEDL